jgi:hypothetical protein
MSSALGFTLVAGQFQAPSPTTTATTQSFATRA